MDLAEDMVLFGGSALMFLVMLKVLAALARFIFIISNKKVMFSVSFERNRIFKKLVNRFE